MSLYRFVMLVGTIALAVAALTVGIARSQQPVPPAAPPTEVPQWVLKYAGNQEQAVRSCQILLSQEQAKIDDLQKQLADAKSALAAAKPVDKPADPKK